MINSRSAHRKPALLLVLLLAACAAEGPVRGSPVTGDARVSVERLFSGDRLAAGQLFRSELPNGEDPPPDGTVELFPDSRSLARGGSGGGGDGSGGGEICNQPTLLTIFPCSFLAVGTLTAVFAVALTAPVWGVPYAAATGEFSDKSADRTHETAAPARLESGSNRKTGTEADRQLDAIVAGVRKAVDAEKLETRLDDAFTTTLARTLEGPQPAPGETTQRISGANRAAVRVLAGLSQLSLTRTPQGDKSLTLCSRAMVPGGASGWRYFRTCLSRKVAPEEYENTEWIESALIAQTQTLALSMARALRAE